MVAANAPDFDVVSFFGTAETYIRWHRHITHSLIALPVMALIAVALVRFIGRKPVRWLPAWGIAMIGVASHLLLDLTNIYGVRLLLPFSGKWFHWDITPVIDPTILVIILLGIAAPALSKLVGGEIGDKRANAGGGWAVAALFLLFAYDATRAVLRDKAATAVAEHRYEGLTPRRTGAFPTNNPLIWTGIAEMSNSYVEIPVNVLEPLHVHDASILYKAEQTPAVNAALASRPFQTFLEFVQYPLWATGPSRRADGGTEVTLVDLRFGTPAAIGFGAVATVTPDGRVVDSLFTMSGARPR